MTLPTQQRLFLLQSQRTQAATEAQTEYDRTATLRELLKRKDEYDRRIAEAEQKRGTREDYNNKWSKEYNKLIAANTNLAVLIEKERSSPGYSSSREGQRLAFYAQRPGASPKEYAAYSAPAKVARKEAERSELMRTADFTEAQVKDFTPYERRRLLAIQRTANAWEASPPERQYTTTQRYFITIDGKKAEVEKPIYEKFQAGGFSTATEGGVMSFAPDTRQSKYSTSTVTRKPGLFSQGERVTTETVTGGTLFTAQPFTISQRLQGSAPSPLYGRAESMTTTTTTPIPSKASSFYSKANLYGSYAVKGAIPGASNIPEILPKIEKGYQAYGGFVQKTLKLDRNPAERTALTWAAKEWRETTTDVINKPVKYAALYGGGYATKKLLVAGGSFVTKTFAPSVANKFFAGAKVAGYGLGGLYVFGLGKRVSEGKTIGVQVAEGAAFAGGFRAATPTIKTSQYSGKVLTPQRAKAISSLPSTYLRVSPVKGFNVVGARKIGAADIGVIKANPDFGRSFLIKNTELNLPENYFFTAEGRTAGVFTRYASPSSQLPMAGTSSFSRSVRFSGTMRAAEFEGGLVGVTSYRFFPNPSGSLGRVAMVGRLRFEPISLSSSRALTPTPIKGGAAPRPKRLGFVQKLLEFRPSLEYTPKKAVSVPSERTFFYKGYPLKIMRVTPPKPSESPIMTASGTILLPPETKTTTVTTQKTVYKPRSTSIGTARETGVKTVTKPTTITQAKPGAITTFSSTLNKPVTSFRKAVLATPSLNSVLGRQSRTTSALRAASTTGAASLTGTTTATTQATTAATATTASVTATTTALTTSQLTSTTTKFPRTPGLTTVKTPPLGGALFTLGGRGGTPTYTTFFREKQPRKYTPSAYALGLGIKGRPTKSGVLTGLGVRPILSKKRRATKRTKRRR